MTGVPFYGATFAESLKDGVILCKLANKIRPGSVRNINDPTSSGSLAKFRCMENIASYLKAVRAVGMKEFEMFGTPDLYEEKNVDQVRSRPQCHSIHRQECPPFAYRVIASLEIRLALCCR